MMSAKLPPIRMLCTTGRQTSAVPLSLMGRIDELFLKYPSDGTHGLSTQQMPCQLP